MKTRLKEEEQLSKNEILALNATQSILTVLIGCTMLYSLVKLNIPMVIMGGLLIFILNTIITLIKLIE